MNETAKSVAIGLLKWSVIGLGFVALLIWFVDLEPEKRVALVIGAAAFYGLKVLTDIRVRLDEIAKLLRQRR